MTLLVNSNASCTADNRVEKTNIYIRFVLAETKKRTITAYSYHMRMKLTVAVMQVKIQVENSVEFLSQLVDAQHNVVTFRKSHPSKSATTTTTTTQLQVNVSHLGDYSSRIQRHDRVCHDASRRTS